MIGFGGWLLWVVAWVALAIGASNFSGYGNEIPAAVAVLAVGIIVSIVVRRLTAAARIVAREKLHAKMEQSIDWDEVDPIPVVAARIGFGNLLQNALFLCLPSVGVGYLLHEHWTESAFTAYGVATASVTGIAAIGSSILAAWMEYDTRRRHMRWRDKQTGPA